MPAYNPNPPLCSIADCEKKANCRGWCRLHYGRWQRQGDPLKVVSRKGVPHHGRPANGRADLFEGWSGAEAWLAGLIWADGCFHEDHRLRAGGMVLVSSVDEEIIDHVVAIAGVQKYSRSQAHRGRRTLYSARLGQPAAVTRLRAIGLMPRKSLTAEFPSVPTDVARHFIRGYFDGDGTVGLYRNPSIVSVSWPPRCMSGFEGSVSFLTDLQALLVEHGVRPQAIRPNRSIWRVRYNHADSLNLGAFMYGDGGPSLTRKRLLFEEAANQRPLYFRGAAAA